MFNSFVAQTLIMALLFQDSISAAVKRLGGGADARTARWPLERTHAAFLSHYKKVRLLLIHPPLLRTRAFAFCKILTLACLQHLTCLPLRVQEAAQEARYIKDKLSQELSAPVFLDSDDLADLRQLCGIVMECDVLILFLTQDLMTRPWCIIELYTAITNDVPIVALKVCGNYRECTHNKHRPASPSMMHISGDVVDT